MLILTKKPSITVDGNLSDWSPSERIDYNDVVGNSYYSDEQNGTFYFALDSNTVIGVGSAFWFDADENPATGYNVFGGSLGADYALMINADGTATLDYYPTNSPTGTPVSAVIPVAFSADYESVEFGISATALGNPTAVDTAYLVTDYTAPVPSTVTGPQYYTLQPYVALPHTSITPTSTATRIGIVYSETTAENYFSRTAYDDLIMSAENQAIQAGVPFDLLTESDLADLSKLSNYSALVFPSFADVQSSQVTAITDTLLQATRDFGIGLITSGNFMTNDQTGLALGGDPYGRMKLLFGVTREAGGNSDGVAITSADTARTVLKDTAPGATIRTYTGTGWAAYQDLTGTSQTIATQTITSTAGGAPVVTGTYPAMMTTQTAGKNVLFSSNGVMADSNLLGQAIDYATQPAGISVSLEETRFKGIVATRMDMDQSQFPSDVTPGGSAAAGIYGKLLPILQQWNDQYDFTGSYYINIGDNPSGIDPSATDWSAVLPYYQDLLAMGGEIGTHSYSHLINPPTTTFTAHTVGTTAAGSTQIRLDSIPSFAGITVGMLVSGDGLGTNTPLPGAAGEGGSVANTYVTAVDPATNTITINYTPGGYGTPNLGTKLGMSTGDTLTFSIPSENTNFLQTTATITGPALASDGDVLSGTANPFTYAYEFGQAKTVLQTQLGTPIYGAAVPGAVEAAQTSLNIMQYFPSGPGYTGYVTGGWTGVGSGYPSAFGYIDPSNTNTIYLAPNLNFDFTGIQYQSLTPDQVGSIWQTQMAGIAANSAGPPIYVWPIHDYGAAAWDTSDSGAASPYTTQMYTDFISAAAAQGDEFVTLEDLAARIQSFANSGVTTSVNGNVITASVASSDAGKFALDVSGQASGQIIENVGNWYAFADDSVFLPDGGGNYTITLGASADPVTHIVSLPMRGDLLSVTGDGVNIAFSMIGEGDVLVNLASAAYAVTGITGGTVVSQTGNQVDVKLTGLGQHDVALTVGAPAPIEAVSSVQFSADSGASATDFITNVAAQTVTGTLRAPLAAGDSVAVSLDNGVTWKTAAATVGGTTFSLPGMTLTGSGILLAHVVNAANVASASLAQAYVLDETSPVETATIAAMTDDSGIAGDFVTNDGAAGRTLSGTLSAALGPDETLEVSSDAGATWTAATVSGTTWSVTDAASHTADWTIEAHVVDLAGNLGPLTTQVATFDAALPAAPSGLALAAGSDDGTSTTDRVTSINLPAVTGTAEVGSTVTLYDAAAVIGTALVGASGGWTIAASTALAVGAHGFTATATDLAGNLGPVSTALPVTIVTPATIPSVPDLATASDSGQSSTDNVTNVVTPVFTGTATAGTVVTLYNGVTALGTATAVSGIWSIAAPSLTNGVQTITATATDAAGNITAASAGLSVTIDTVAPGAPSVPDLVAASDSGLSGTDDITNVKTPTLTGTAETGSTVALYDGTTLMGTALATGGNWSILSTAVLADGVHSITAKATDVAGNVGLVSAALSLTVDSVAPTAPSIPTLAPGSDNGVSTTDNITSIVTPTFMGNAAANSTVTLYDGTVVLGTALASATGAWSITSPTLANGMHSITAKASDVAGNLSVASATRLVTIAATVAAPSMPDLTNASDSGVLNTDNITNDKRPTFTGTATAGSTVTLYDGVNTIGTAKAGGAGNWSIVTAAALADGAHAITATATDAATGVVSPASPALTVTIDTAAPAAPSALALAAASDRGVSNSDRLTNVVRPTFTGSAESGSTITLYDGIMVIGTAVAAGGSWSITSTRDLANGAHSITAKATDVAGNIGAASAALALTIDTTKPARPAAPKLTAATDTGVSSTDGITRIPAPTLMGTAEAGTTVTVFDGTTPIGTAVAAPVGGAWSLTTPTLGDGAHSITTQAMDAAGNVSASSPVRTVTIDTTAPVGPAMTSGTVASLSGTGEAGDTVTFYAGAVIAGATTVNAAGAWNWLLLPSVGVRTITATQTDKAGNTGVLGSSRAIIGGLGADTLTASSGNEILIGGAGADTYVFSGGFGQDIIAAFKAAGRAHDMITFQSNPALSNYTNVMSHAAQVGTSVVITQDASNVLTLLGTTKAALTAADFKFV